MFVEELLELVDVGVVGVVLVGVVVFVGVGVVVVLVGIGVDVRVGNGTGGLLVVAEVGAGGLGEEFPAGGLAFEVDDVAPPAVEDCPRLGRCRSRLAAGVPVRTASALAAAAAAEVFES